MTVRYSRRALADLDGLVSYISQDNPDAAVALRVDVETLISHLGRLPYAGRRTDAPGVRVLTMRKHPYLVFYKVYADIRSLPFCQIGPSH